MSIQCRTGCGSQVTYVNHNFSDGFIYYLPLNLDGKIHKCPNLPINYETEWPGVSYDEETGELVDKPDNSNNYFEFFQDLQEPYHLFEKIVEKREKKPWSRSLLKATLRGYQIESVALTLPFYQLDSEEDPTFYQLTGIADCYEELGEYENALFALTIQNRATNDQMKRIIGITKKISNNQKSEELIFDKEEKVTIENIIKKIHKIEQLMKSYLRKKYQKNRKLFEDNRTLIKSIEKRISEEMLIDKKMNDEDLIDKMSFGNILSIITFWKTKSYFPEFTIAHIPYLELVLQFRNQIMAHPKDVDPEKLFNNIEKQSYNNFCYKILNHFDDIEKR